MDPVLEALIDADIITKEEAWRIMRTLSPEAARQWAEDKMQIAWQAALAGQQQRLLNLAAAGLVVGGIFWADEDRFMSTVLMPTLEEIAAEEGAFAATEAGLDIEDMWQSVQRESIAWVQQYYTSESPDFYGSLPNINRESRRQFGDIYTRWLAGDIPPEKGEGIYALIAESQEVFGAERAENIAVTETTRIGYEMARSMAEKDSDLTHKRLATARDEVVCKVCGPLHGQVASKDAPYMHPKFGAVGVEPFHPRCRCQSSFMSALVAGLYDPEVEQGSR